MEQYLLRLAETAMEERKLLVQGYLLLLRFAIRLLAVR
jgi:hypothetical protein